MNVLKGYIHVVKGDDFATIDLSTLKLRVNYFKPAEVKNALAIVAELRSEFVRKWDEFFQR